MQNLKKKIHHKGSESKEGRKDTGKGKLKGNGKKGVI